ncbi:extracellular catalytic domain type 1 short-chain-length polyhydroxyalkanoate depolymerase [Lysobacter claricitrinus]|uniref:extracellular catalytic domain type 1 short-chain-length polyhydroxyalkanoate depolymerase n=1 Tax=Lysobacter claricitrinus TaxID=3367728 RepID=UPI0037DB43B4
MHRWRYVAIVLLLVVAADVFAQARGGRFAEILRARAAQRQADAAMVRGGDPRARLVAPGDYRYDIQHDGITRMYRVHVPRSYRPGHPTALLVALHGGGGDMDWQADDSKYGLITASEAHGFIAVFPNGFSRMPGGRLATWNAGRCCGAARDRRVDDVGFIRAVVDNVEHQVDVDRSRVYATGMSNGGLMAYRLACDAADVFRAIAPVAGTDNTTHCTPSRPVSIAHFHARDDDHVLFDGGAGPDAFRDRSMVTEFTSVPATIEQWSRHDGCSTPARRVLSVPGAYCELRAPCAGGAKVQLCVTETGAHSWPGGHKDRGEPASQAISANELMWRFFESL